MVIKLMTSNVLLQFLALFSTGVIERIQKDSMNAFNIAHIGINI